MIAPSTINFFRQQSQEVQKQDDFDTWFFRASGGFGALCLCIFVGVIIWWQLGVRSLAEARQQEAQHNQIITRSGENEAQYLSFVARLDELAQLLQNRNSKKEALDFLSLLVRPAIGFDAINYDAKGKKLTFRVSAESVFSVEEFLEDLRRPDIQAYYTDIQVSNIRRDDQGSYIMELIVTLREAQNNGN